MEDEVAAKERLREVRAAIARMPRSLRDPLVLRVEDELSTAEIAERLGITVFAVRQRLTRARHFLSA
ncbi:RNA polymerase sigma factor [Mycobacterium tuberculosis]|nr:RNA polymerase sigma factor [Mycobacterium tuberculosis]